MSRFSLLEKILIAAVVVLFIALIIVIAVFASQSSNDDNDSSVNGVSDGSSTAKLRAICNMMANTQNNVTGTVKFEQMKGHQISVDVNIIGVPVGPNNNNSHGFHVHYYGDITTCGSTGGHYNPKNVNHAGPTDTVRHPGDFGNIVQDGSGNIVHKFNDPIASLFGPESIFGRAIVLHTGQDDLGKGTGSKEKGSLASGNAGPRLACCVIGHQKP